MSIVCARTIFATFALDAWLISEKLMICVSTWLTFFDGKSLGSSRSDISERLSLVVRSVCLMRRNAFTTGCLPKPNFW